MAKAPVVEESEFRRAIKVAGVTGHTKLRDVAILCTLYGTGITATELAQLEVADVYDESGAFREKSVIRPEIAFNGKARPIFWTNDRVKAALDAYAADRIATCQGTTAWRSRWKGLVHLGPMFLTNDGRPFTLTTRKTAVGNTSKSCESLTQVIRRLHDQAGIECAGSTATRRTFAVRLHRKGYDLRHIREVLGLCSLSATKNLVEGDPVDLGRIVAKVF